MLPIPARSCQRAISTITDARVSQQSSLPAQTPKRVSSVNVVGAAVSFSALAYLCNFEQMQTRLILLLQDWSTLLRSGNDAIVSLTVAVAPFLLGGVLLALCHRLLGNSIGTRRHTR